MGSASLELDDKGNVISYEEYYPYGSTSYQAVDQSIKAAAKRYRYTGKERDEETGFTYHGARYYAPWLGRWMSCDPAGLLDGPCVYRYALNSPVNLHDSNGMQAGPWTPIVKLTQLGQTLRDNRFVQWTKEHPLLTALAGPALVVGVDAGVTIGPAAMAWALAHPATVVATGEFAVGLADPHPPGASPLDLPGPIDDAGRATRAIVKEGAEKLAQPLERRVVQQVKNKVVQQVENKVVQQAHPKLVSEADKKLAGEAEKKLAKNASDSTGSLKFGENDLVYGPSAGGKLRNLQEQAGGKLLNDLDKPMEQSFIQFSLETLDRAATRGQKVHFDLTHVKDLANVLAGKGELANTVTAQELRHVAQNWEKFKNIVTFYVDGKVKQAPWMK